MYTTFFKNRLTQLRLQKAVSEYKMSLDLGHSKSYIQSISSGRALPSLTEFFSICDYFKITPSEFFDNSNKNPVRQIRINQLTSNLNDNDLELLLTFLERLQK